MKSRNKEKTYLGKKLNGAVSETHRPPKKKNCYKEGGRRGLEVKRAAGDQGVGSSNPAATSYFDLFSEDQPIDVLEKDEEAQGGQSEKIEMTKKTKWIGAYSIKCTLYCHCCIADC